MISGIERAVGPLQPGEMSGLGEPYWCEQGRAFPEAQTLACLFVIYDGGSGKAYLRCSTHDYAMLAIDWTAPHFTALTMAESLARLREIYERAKKAGANGVDPKEPTLTAETFGDVFAKIIKNTEAMLLENLSEPKADGDV